MLLATHRELLSSTPPQYRDLLLQESSLQQNRRHVQLEEGALSHSQSLPTM